MRHKNQKPVKFVIPRALEVDCVDCGGTGVIRTPAYQQAGLIVDESERTCHCVKAQHEEPDRSDWDL